MMFFFEWKNNILLLVTVTDSCDYLQYRIDSCECSAVQKLVGRVVRVFDC